MPCGISRGAGLAVIVLCAFIAVTGPSPAAVTTILGAGTLSCGQWTEKRDFDHAYMLSWVLGFMSANNQWMKKDLTSGTDSAGLEAWIGNYCSAHPLDALAVAASNLAVELATRQGLLK